MSTRSISQQVGDDAVVAATGRPREEWFAVLDAARAAAATAPWPHPQIVAVLVERGVDDWWAQSITIAYEQARGLRVPGQRADGTFETSVSVTVPRPAADVEAQLLDAGSVAAWVGAALEEALPGASLVPFSATVGRAVRWRLHAPGVERALKVEARLEPVDARTRVVVSTAGLPDAATQAVVRALWKDRLGAL